MNNHLNMLPKQSKLSQMLQNALVPGAPPQTLLGAYDAPETP